MTLPDVRIDSETLSQEEQYAERVKWEIDLLGKYFRRQIIWYRATRSIVIVSAAAVPVLAAVGQFPRWGLGTLGAVAVVAEAFQQLFQFRLSALNAVKTANTLERELNRYRAAVKPYEGCESDAFPPFAEKIEEIRAEADRTIVEIWERATPEVRVVQPKS